MADADVKPHATSYFPKHCFFRGRQVTHVLSVPLVLDDNGSLHVLVQGLLCERVHLFPSLQGLLPQGHLPLLCHLSLLLGICKLRGSILTKYCDCIIGPFHAQLPPLPPSWHVR